MRSKQLVQYGDWKLIWAYEQPRILHRCEESRYSWEINGEDSWSAMSWHGCCIACDAVPPVAMQGFLNLLDWEK